MIPRSPATRALLRLEWSSVSTMREGTMVRCPVCFGQRSRGWGGPDGHREGCDLDWSLTDVGLVSQAEREAARRELDDQR